MTLPGPSRRQPIPFGKYLLLDRINIGGMAEVWRGKTFGAGGFQRLVAIKRILPNIAEDTEFISMFIDEAKITVQLTHPHIVQTFDLGYVSSSYYIAMEYLGGKDLRALFDRCRKKGTPPSPELAAFVMAGVCEGLDFAHRCKDNAGRDMNIVHRDVSPQNVLISYDGEVKVIDFGIAKAAGKATRTQAGILKGKFGYMSPEQVRGHNLDRRSDIFSAGICLWEVLTGERLFVAETDVAVLEKVRRVDVAPPTKSNPRVPAALERICMKALTKDVEQRYQHAGELAADLRGWLDSVGATFGTQELSDFMHATFTEDVERERQRLQEYESIQPPPGMAGAADLGLGGIPSAAPAPRVVATGPAGSTPASTARPVLVPIPTPIATTTVGPRTPATASLAPKITAAAPMLTNRPDAGDVVATQLNVSVPADVLARGPRKSKAVVEEPVTSPGIDRDVPRPPVVDSHESPTRLGLDLPIPPRRKTPVEIETDPKASYMPFTSPPPGPLTRPMTGPIARQISSSSPSKENYEALLSPSPGVAGPRADLFADTADRTDPDRQPAPRNLTTVVLIGLVVALVLALAFLWHRNDGNDTGVIMIELPTAVGSNATVKINGKVINGPDGQPHPGPRIFYKGDEGPTTLTVEAKGFKPFTTVVELDAEAPHQIMVPMEKLP